MRVLVAVLRAEAEGLVYMRWLVTAMQVMVVAAGFWLIGIVGLSFWQLWHARPTSSWDTFTNITLDLGLLFTALVAQLIPQYQRRWRDRLRGSVQTLLHAVRDSNEDLAPLARTHPDQLPGEEAVAAPALLRIADASPAMRGLMISLFIALGLVGAGCIGMGIWLGTLLNSLIIGSTSVDRVALIAYFGLVATLLVAGGAGMMWLMVFSLRREVRYLRGQRFEADEWGLRRVGNWRGWGTAGIAWNEARGFSRMEVWGGPDLDHKQLIRHGAGAIEHANYLALERDVAYVLDAGDHMLVWVLGKHADANDEAEHERLCRLIVTRTKLPVRDLTVAAAEVLQVVREEFGAVGQ